MEKLKNAHYGFVVDKKTIPADKVKMLFREHAKKLIRYTSFIKPEELELLTKAKSVRFIIFLNKSENNKMELKPKRAFYKQMANAYLDIFSD